MKNRIVLISGLLFLVFAACTPQTQSLFSTLRPGEIAAVSPTTLDEVASDYNVARSIVSASGASLTTIVDTIGTANSLEVKSTFAFPATVANSLSFTAGQNQAVYASGILPKELYDKFSFFTVMQIASGTGQVFIYDTNDTNDLAAVSVSGTQLVLKHQSSAGNYRSRAYNISQFLNQWAVYAFAFGSEGKDIQLYINGYRLTEYTSQSVGGIGAFSAVQRHITIGGPSHATFRIKHFSLVGSQILPYQMFQASKFLSKTYGIYVSDSVTKEIRNNTAPPVEPETINYTFLASTILTSKCVGCHSPAGGYLPYLNSYTNLMAAMSGSDRVVTPGDIANSRLYQTVMDNGMPAGGAGPLSATEKNYIKSWIENGALND